MNELIYGIHWHIPEELAALHRRYKEAAVVFKARYWEEKDLWYIVRNANTIRRMK